MDDLVEHFSELGAEVLRPPVPQPPPEDAAAKTPRVDELISPPAPTSSTTSTPLTMPTTVKGWRPSIPDAQPPIASTPSKDSRPSARFTGDGTMALDAYRELFRQQDTSPVAEVYGALGIQSTAQDAHSVDHYHDDDDDGDYIPHFHDKDSTVQAAPRAPHQRLDLLSKLEDINRESYTKHDAIFEGANAYPLQDGVDASRTVTQDVGNSDMDGESEDFGETNNDRSRLEVLVEPASSNNTDFNEPNGDFDQTSSDAGKIARTIKGTNRPPGDAHSAVPAQSADHMNMFARRLRELHKQDIARDELLIDLHREVQDLRQALRAEDRGSQSSSERPELHGDDPRTVAAERSLIEARQDMQKNPFVCVLIDGEGYDVKAPATLSVGAANDMVGSQFHEDLLQAGRDGGLEAAARLVMQIQDHAEKFNNSNSVDVVVHLYMDVEGLLNRCNASQVWLSETSLRDFVRGFTLSPVAPLFSIVDVGGDKENTSRKIEGMFHLFANNVHCKRIFIGCCHDSAYAMPLSAYTGNPIIAPRITLLASSDNDDYYGSLNYEIIDLPYVFRPISFSAKGSPAGNGTGNKEYGDFWSQANARTPSTVSDQPTKWSGAITDWQKAANESSDSIAASRPRRPPSHSPKKGRKQERTVLLNINNERVDLPQEEEDFEVKESMLDRMEEREFCVFHHLRGGCLTESLGKSCKFKHGPALKQKELVVLKNHVRRMPCDKGPKCRHPNCMYGHVCPNQPDCHRGARCQLYKFHEVDPTAVKVWRP